MGKARVGQEESMEQEVPQQNNIPHTRAPAPKKKTIRKPKPAALQQSQSLPKEQKKLTSGIVRKFAKKVNLSKPRMSLQDKQNIFHKVVKEISGKKVSRKQRKKQHYLIKKNLKGQIDQRLPVSEQVPRQEGMEEEAKPLIKRPKFSKEEAIQGFKDKMGLGLGSIKQQLMSKRQTVK